MTRLTLILVLSALGAFFGVTMVQPYEMLPPGGACGESPVGFYRFGVVAYEFDEAGGSAWQLTDRYGGLSEFLRWMVGAWQPCA